MGVNLPFTGCGGSLAVPRLARGLLLGLCLAVTVLAASGAPAQRLESIAAVVNDEVISAYDVRARIELVVRSSNLTDTPELRRRLVPQVIRALIDERLQLQEAKARNVSVSKRDIARAKEELERQNHMPKGELERFLARAGIPAETLEQQIRAQIAWAKLIQRQLAPRVQIGEEEIDDFLARLRARQGQTEYRLAEIFLDVPRPGDEPEVRRSAARLVEQVRGGASFASLARQFSQSPTATVGGDLGWAVLSELDETMRPVARRLSKGEVSDPVRVVSGYQILYLVDTRRFGSPQPAQIKLDLRQLFLPVPEGASAAAAEGVRERARRAVAGVETCKDFAAAAEKAGSQRPAALGQLSLADLSATVRKAVETLPAGGISAPFDGGGGWTVLMVCDRERPKAALPDREQVRDILTRRREALMAQRYLRDLRLAAILDIRT